MVRNTLLRIACAAAVALADSPAGGVSTGQGVSGFLPVGVRYEAPDDPAEQRGDLAHMRQLRFNVVELLQAGGHTGAGALMFIDRLLAGAPDPRVMLPLRPPATIAVGPETRAAALRAQAWTALARGAQGVIFADWTALLRHPAALEAASAFAEATSRNPTLYAPLRPVAAPPGERLVHVAGGEHGVEARLLESADALVLIAVNGTDREQTVTMTFSADVPEAIWQKMLGSGAVSFVAGPAGPVYERTLPPHDVVLLMIRKSRR